MHQQYIQPCQPVLVLSNNTAMPCRQKGKYSSLWLNMFFQAEFHITIDEVSSKLTLVENANNFGKFVKSVVLHNWRNKRDFTTCPHKAYLLKRVEENATKDWSLYFGDPESEGAIEYIRDALKQLKFDAGYKVRF